MGRKGARRGKKGKKEIKRDGNETKREKWYKNGRKKG